MRCPTTTEHSPHGQAKQRSPGQLRGRRCQPAERASGRPRARAGGPEEEAEDYLYGTLENLVPAMREQSARLREQQQRELKRHLRNEQELAKLRARKREQERQIKEQRP
jgi:hypothetical protein